MHHKFTIIDVGAGVNSSITIVFIIVVIIILDVIYQTYCIFELFENRVGSVTTISQAVGSDSFSYYHPHFFLDLTLFARVKNN